MGFKDKVSLTEIISSPADFMVNGVKLWIEGSTFEGEDGAEKSTIFDIKDSNLFLSKLSNHFGFHIHPITRPTRKAVQIGAIKNIISTINPLLIDVGRSNIAKIASINQI